MYGGPCAPSRCLPLSHVRCEFWDVADMGDGAVRGFCGRVDDDPLFDPMVDCVYKMCHLHRPDLFECVTLEEIARCLGDQPGASVMFFDGDHCEPFD